MVYNLPFYVFFYVEKVGYFEKSENDNNYSRSQFEDQSSSKHHQQFWKEEIYKNCTFNETY